MMNNGRAVIAIIDDDPIIVKLLCQVLGESEFEVAVINEGDDIPKAVETNKVDLVLIDLNLKNHYGFEIARSLRPNEDLGLIMLTGSNNQIDKVVGLELGLDDYIAKPFDNRELKARCRNVLRRIKKSVEPESQAAGSAKTEDDSKRLILTNLTLDKIHFKLIADNGCEQKLTAYEYRLLEILLNSEGEAVSRDDLSQQIYNREWSPETRALDVLVGKLRKKIQLLDENIAIATIRGQGYMLIK